MRLPLRLFLSYAAVAIIGAVVAYLTVRLGKWSVRLTALLVICQTDISAPSQCAAFRSHDPAPGQWRPCHWVESGV
jgi:hypothetical protein